MKQAMTMYPTFRPIQRCSNLLFGWLGELSVKALAKGPFMLEAIGAGGSPNPRLNARLKAASDSYPTSPAISATGESKKSIVSVAACKKVQRCALAGYWEVFRDSFTMAADAPGTITARASTADHVPAQESLAKGAPPSVMPSLAAAEGALK